MCQDTSHSCLEMTCRWGQVPRSWVLVWPWEVSLHLTDCRRVSWGPGVLPTHVTPPCTCSSLLSGFLGPMGPSGIAWEKVTAPVARPGRCGWVEAPAICPTLPQSWVGSLPSSTLRELSGYPCGETWGLAGTVGTPSPTTSFIAGDAETQRG